MRGFAVWKSAILVLGLAIATAGPAFSQDLIPAKRLTLSENTDLPGGDITSIFDTTLEACEAACLTNKQCTAFTFNTKNGSCFPKKGAGEGTYFEGAYSGFVIPAAKGVEGRAKTRRSELTFVQDWDMTSATSLAGNLANLHVTNDYSAADDIAAALDAEGNGDFDSAYRFAGAATNVEDTADNWLEYARLQLEAATRDQNNASGLRSNALLSTYNAYLRSENVAQRHTILVMMGQALEAVGRGRDTVKALRLAQDLQPRDDTAVALDDAIGKYGFRIVENEINSDSDRPRICVSFSEDLAKSGVDYSTFVQLPQAGMSVASDGYRKLCVEGVEPGGRYTVTFREGLPAADGQTMAKSVPITAYIRDRSAAVRFTGRGYVLPRTGGAAAIPVETVNTNKLDLKVYRVTDRNLMRVMQNGYFG